MTKQTLNSTYTRIVCKGRPALQSVPVHDAANDVNLLGVKAMEDLQRPRGAGFAVLGCGLKALRFSVRFRGL